MVAIEEPEVILNVTPRLSAVVGEDVAVNDMVSPTSPDDDPEMDTDVTRISGSEMVMVLEAVTPEPSSAVARTVMEPAAVRLIVHELSFWEVMLA